MSSGVFYRRHYPWRLSILLFFVELFDQLSSDINERVLDRLISSFNRITKMFNLGIETADKISKEDAMSWLKGINVYIKLLDKIEPSIERIDKKELSDTFKLFKKSLFKFEATLHRISTFNNPIIETPQYLKEHFSKKGLASIFSRID